MPEKKTKVKLGLKNLAMLPNYFDYIFVHLRKKITSQARINSKVFVNFRPEPCPNPNPTRKVRPTYNSEQRIFEFQEYFLRTYRQIHSRTFNKIGMKKKT